MVREIGFRPVGDVLSDRQVGFLAVVVLLAALIPLDPWTGWKLARWSMLVIVAAALLRGNKALVIATLPIAALCASGAAWSSPAVDAPFEFHGQIELTSDPRPAPGGMRVDATVDGHHTQLRAFGSSAGHLRPRLLGEVLNGSVRVRPLDDPPKWLIARGVEARGSLVEVSGFDVGQPHTRLANSLRRTIESGAFMMSRDERALFTGLVYGDDRFQGPTVTDNFTASGLTHLLAVSGQNVAFALAIVGPLLRRCGYRGRFVIVLMVLAVFATVTRFEASVIRASAMVAVAATGVLVGVEVSSRRVLALALIGLTLVNPLLVHSVAFQLSVAASTGILLWSARVARAIPGPRIFAEGLAVTSSAQLAVAPLLMWYFDGLPVGSLPANLIAGPAAGPTMMWGMTAGWLAGVVPRPVALVLHLPTRALMWWIASVSEVIAQAPMGDFDTAHLVLLFGGAAIGLRQIGFGRRMAATAFMVAVVIQPAMALAIAAPVSFGVDESTYLLRDETFSVLVLDPATDEETLLAMLRRHDVREIDLVVARRGGIATHTHLRWLGPRYRLASVWAPPNHGLVSAAVPPDGAQVEIAGRVVLVSVSPDGGELDVTLSEPAGPA